MFASVSNGTVRQPPASGRALTMKTLCRERGLSQIAFSRSVLPVLVACGLLLALGGCNGGPKPPPLAVVTGRVTLDGKPLPKGVVVFHPDRFKGTTGPTGAGEIDQNGRYLIRTAGRNGALVGWHVITVEAFDNTIEGNPSIVSRKYRRPDMSILKSEVKAGIENVIDLPLVSNP